MNDSLLIRGGTIVTERGEEQQDIVIEGGVIQKIESQKPATSNQQPSDEIINATGLLLFPGFIDCHVHFREPGLTHKADMASESAAALAGGVTTVCEMPNTIPPAVTVEAFADKVKRAEACQAHPSICQAERSRSLDIRFFFGATKREHLTELHRLFTDPTLTELKARCSGLKIYFDHSTGDQGVDVAIIEHAFELCAELNIVTVCHCEDAAMNRMESEKWKNDVDISVHSHMRPPESEEAAVRQAIQYAADHGNKLHIAHISTAQGVELVRQAKAQNLPVTCEATPHHLLFSTDDYKKLSGYGKMNPPLRTHDHVEALWAGIADGTIDCIATDHAPHTKEEKIGPELGKIASGVPGVETMIPLMLGAMSDKRLTVSDLHRLCFANPNRIFNLGKRGIVEGAPADIVLIDPAAQWTIDAKHLHSKCGWSPYEGRTVQGRVVRVIR
jgi:dihydroorotase